MICDFARVLAQLKGPSVEEARVCVWARKADRDGGVAVVVEKGGRGQCRVCRVDVDVYGEEGDVRQCDGEEEGSCVTGRGLAKEGVERKGMRTLRRRRDPCLQ